MKERSYFWPLVLIATGVLWLLINAGVVPSANLWALLHMLPLVLIALGFGLILRAFWRPAGMLVSLLVVAAAALGVVYAPSFGWDFAPRWSLWQFDAPGLGGAQAGSGVRIEETREVADFTSLSIEYPVRLTIVQGKAPSLSLTADDNLLEQISTEVRGESLVIENRVRDWGQRVRPSKTVEITLTVTDLERVDFSSAGDLLVDGYQGESLEIYLSGAGQVELRDVDLDRLSLVLSGAGDLSASGRARTLEMRISGFGSYKGTDLHTQEAQVSISGAGDASVWAEEALDVRISGAGSVRYLGHPERVTQQISGAGNVREMSE